MRMRCPYPEPRVMPWLNDRQVEPDEVVDVPDDMVEHFAAAGWREPDQPVEWPPRAAEPEPAGDQVPPDTGETTTTADTTDTDAAATTGTDQVDATSAAPRKRK